MLLDGHDARDCSLEWVRDQVAVVLQDTVLFSGTVHDNIAYATDATREQVEAGRLRSDGPAPPWTVLDALQPVEDETADHPGTNGN